MGAKTFRQAWQLARELRRMLRPFWRRAEAARDYRLSNQLRAAARSTTSNIAEGFPCSIEMIDDELMTEAEAKPAMRLKMRTSRAIAAFRAYLLSTPDPPTYKPRAKRPQRTRRTRRT